MARVRAFHAVYFDQKQAGNISKLVSPPYDVISADEARMLRARSPFNTIHLELGEPGDVDFYRRSASLIERWLKQGILRRTARPAVYFYESEFGYRMGGREQKKTRRGFFALLGVSDYERGEVLRHEHTLSGPKHDRLQLLRATRTNISPIFVLYSDPRQSLVNALRKARPSEPVFDLTDDQGIRHRLVGVSEDSVLDKIGKFLRQRSVYIADGHHRYETALNFHKELAEAKDPMAEASGWVMTYFCPLQDQGLVIFPYHRLVRKLPEQRLAGMRERLGQDFILEQVAERFDQESSPRVFQALDRAGKSRAVLMIDQERKAWLLKLKPGLQKELQARLDVEILRELVFERGLGITQQEIADKNFVQYETREELILKRLKEEDFQLAFLLRPLAVDKVVERADQGGVMPQKSTYFYPKLPSGLVFRKMCSGSELG